MGNPGLPEGNAAEALDQSERRLRDLLERSQDILFTLSREGIVTSLNPAFEKSTGWRRDAWLYRPFFLLIRPEDRAAAAEALRKAADGGELPPLELRMRSRSQGEVVLECTLCAVREGSSESFWGIARDVTHRRRLEEKVQRAEKMEAMARLSGGIAHDFNNLLTAITAYTDLLHRSLERGSPLLENVDNIQSSVERATKLTRQLLAFSRHQVTKPRRVNLNEVVARMRLELERLADEGIDLSLDLQPDLSPILADPGQMDQVLQALVANARDAMPHGGRLSLVTKEVDPNPQAGETWPSVVLTVADTGQGMTEAVKTHLFEPFFTTKPLGGGTGMGLSAVYGIVKLVGGDIRVDSAPGRGSVFRVAFPRAEETAAEPAAPSAPERRGGETILVVEDDDEVRSLIVTILRNDGYQVLEAGDGEQALSLAGAHEGPVHLVLADMQLPRLGGRQLVQRLLTGRPASKVMFMSGYAREDFPASDWDGAVDGFLEKPFMPKSLLRQIRRVLDG